MIVMTDDETTHSMSLVIYRNFTIAVSYKSVSFEKTQ